MTSPVDRPEAETQWRRKVSWKEFYSYLYGHHDLQAVDPDEIRVKRTRTTSRSSDGETAGIKYTFSWIL